MGGSAALAVLIDFDGVLRVWPAPSGSLGVPEQEIRQVAFAPELLGQVTRGAVTDEAWRGEVARRLASRYGPTAAAVAVAEWSQTSGVIVSAVQQSLSRLRQGVRLVLATNATSRLNADLKSLGLAATFYAVANSSAIGSAKPDPQFFAEALALAGVEAQHAVFIDDSVQNVEAAARLGLRSHHFEGAASMERFLASHGALVGA